MGLALTWKCCSSCTLSVWMRVGSVGQTNFITIKVLSNKGLADTYKNCSHTLDEYYLHLVLQLGCVGLPKDHSATSGYREKLLIPGQNLVVIFQLTVRNVCYLLAVISVSFRVPCCLIAR
jgi:hypothetical protein